MSYTKMLRVYSCVIKTTNKPTKKEKNGRANVIPKPLHIQSLNLGNKNNIYLPILYLMTYLNFPCYGLPT